MSEKPQSDEPETDCLVDKLIDENADDLRASFQASQAQMLSVAEVLKSGIASSKKVGWAAHMDIWNISLFLNLAALDLSMTIEHVLFERVDWRRKLQSRYLATMIYEIAEDHTQLLGKPMRSSLDTLGLLDSFQSKLKVAKKPIDEFWKQHQPEMSKIRNFAGAHRAHDCFEFLKMNDEINPHDIYRLGMDLGQRLNACGIFLQELMKVAASTLPPQKPNTVSPPTNLP